MLFLQGTRDALADTHILHAWLNGSESGQLSSYFRTRIIRFMCRHAQDEMMRRSEQRCWIR